MFTGIIENTGTIVSITEVGTNLEFWIKSEISKELKIDQSVAHNGICLTVTEIVGDTYKVVAIDETRSKTNISAWVDGSRTNLERCMPANGRFDGHIVQGHVDCTAELINLENKDGSYLLTFSFPAEKGTVVEKGSVCVNGISLTVVNAKVSEFSVAIIPYTWEHTNLSELEIGSKVNIEFDIVGKYIAAMMGKRE